MFPNAQNGCHGRRAHALMFSLVLMIFASLSVDGNQTDDQEVDWTSRGVQLRKAGRYAEAAGAFRKALAVAERENTDPREKIGLHDALASTYDEMGQFSDSVSEYQRALALAEKTDNRNILLRGLLLAKMISVRGEDRSSPKIISQLYTAITASRENASADQLAVLRVSLASILSGHGKQHQAESLLLDALADLQADRSSTPRRTLDTLIAFAKLRFDQRRYSESGTLHAQALDLLQATSGRQQSTTALLLSSLSMDYMKTGRLQEAADTGRRALAIVEKTGAEDHPNYAIVLSNQAVLMHRLGRNSEAKELTKKSKQIENEYRRRNGVGSTIAVTSLR